MGVPQVQEHAVNINLQCSQLPYHQSGKEVQPVKPDGPSHSSSHSNWLMAYMACMHSLHGLGMSPCYAFTSQDFVPAYATSKETGRRDTSVDVTSVPRASEVQIERPSYYDPGLPQAYGCTNWINTAPRSKGLSALHLHGAPHY